MARGHALSGDLHTRVVGWLKILLPLLALAILSTMFLVSRNIDPSGSVPYAEVDVEGLANDQGVGKPAYSGVTRDGAAIGFQADSAKPDPQTGSVVAVSPRARIELPGGRVIVVTAAEGRVERAVGQIALSGDTLIATSDGYRVATEQLTAQLDLARMETAGAISGKAPFGTLKAGKMILTRDEAEPSGHVLRFEDGVKLLYQPRP